MERVVGVDGDVELGLGSFRGGGGGQWAGGARGRGFSGRACARTARRSTFRRRRRSSSRARRRRSSSSRAGGASSTSSRRARRARGRRSSPDRSRGTDGAGRRLERVHRHAPRRHRRGERVRRRDRAVGAHGSRVVVGEHCQDSTICGRPAIVLAALARPGDADAPALCQHRRASTRRSAPAPRRSRRPPIATRRATLPIRLLRMKVASSAIEQSLGSLNDGNLDTWWSEAKVGDGRGEFVTFDAAADVPVSGLEIVVRPGVDVPHGVAPKTDLRRDERTSSIASTFPEDGFRKRARSTFSVTFPEPLKTSCLPAIVARRVVREQGRQGRAHDADRGDREDAVRRDGSRGARRRARRRRRTGARRRRDARAHGGPTGGRGRDARAYAKLDDLGKELARNAIDAGAPCSVRGALLRQTLRRDGRARQDRRRRAGRRRSRLFAREAPAHHRLQERRGQGVRGDAGARRTPRVRVARGRRARARRRPGQAVPPLVDFVATADATSRGELLRALSAAARSPRARGAVGRELRAGREVRSARSEARSDLRAPPRARAGARARRGRRPRGASPRWRCRAAPFATRYLLRKRPGAELAKGGDANG